MVVLQYYKTLSLRPTKKLKTIKFIKADAIDTFSIDKALFLFNIMALIRLDADVLAWQSTG